MEISQKKVSLLYLLLIVDLIFSIIPYNSVFCGKESPIVVPTDYPTIQGAINSANNGDTIFIMPGTYKETIRISKSINLIGSGQAVTIIEGNGSLYTIILENVKGCIVSNFTVMTNGNSSKSGIYVLRGSNNLIENMTITGHFYGIHIYDSAYNILKNNNITKNQYNLRIWGLYLSHFLHDINPSNVVNGKPVYYLINKKNLSVPNDAGYVALVNCTNILLKNLSLSKNSAGVLLAYTNLSLIIDVTCNYNEYGVYLINSHNNLIVNSSLMNNYWNGILTISASNNKIFSCHFKDNFWQGIRLSHSAYLLSQYSENNLILGNSIVNSSKGIYLERSSNNTICGNFLEENKQYGIVIEQSNNNTIFRNILRNNNCGLYIYQSNNNKLYFNTFSNNVIQANIHAFTTSKNTWDAGYSIGGNYWSELTKTDLYSGPHQNLTGSDGIVDNPYIIDANNKDRYPLCKYPPLNKQPEAQFRYEPLDPKVQESINFTNVSTDLDGHIIFPIWNVGGTFYLGNQSLKHSFNDYGNYMVKLTVYDNGGEFSSISSNLTVRKKYVHIAFKTTQKSVIGENFTISVTVESETGELLIDAPIYFYLIDGNHCELIGFSLTDSSGMATICYVPLQAGEFKIWAVYKGNKSYYESGNFHKLTITNTSLEFFWILLFAFIIICLVLVTKKWINTKQVSTGELDE